MSSCEQHAKDSEKAGYGKWLCVHKWLDEYVKIYKTYDSIWKGHRIHRHHREGIKEVEEKWGKDAAKAAELHIRSDFDGYLPEDRKEVETIYDVYEDRLNINNEKKGS